MEKIKEGSNKLQKELLPQIEQTIKDYIDRVTIFKAEQKKIYQGKIDSLSEKLDRIMLGIEGDEAAISFIKSQMNNNLQDKENNQNPKKTLHQKVERSRRHAEMKNKILRFYEKRLGLSLKKLSDDTL